MYHYTNKYCVLYRMKSLQRSMVTHTHTWLGHRMLRSAYLNILKVHGFTQLYIYANRSHSSAAAVSNNLWEILINRVLSIWGHVCLYLCMFVLTSTTIEYTDHMDHYHLKQLGQIDCWFDQVLPIFWGYLVIKKPQTTFIWGSATNWRT